MAPLLSVLLKIFVEQKGMNRVVKLIAIDMDGTLLNEKGEVSLANAQAIRSAQKQGVHVVIATGRSYNGALGVLQPAEIDCPIIHLNGACTRSLDGELLRSVRLDNKTAHMIHQAFQETGIYHELYTDDGIFANRDGYNHLKVEMDLWKSANPAIQPEMMQMMVKKQFRQAQVRDHMFLEDVIAEPSYQIYKILAFSMMHEKLEQAHSKVAGLDNIVITSSANNNIEINHLEAQKGKALAELASRWDIPLAETMAIGDNRNDLSMLQMAGIGVAMGNAEQEIKDLCDFVTRPNDEDGVAFAIQKFVLKETHGMNREL